MAAPESKKKNKQLLLKLRVEPDYIAIKRFEYSLQRLLQRYPEGCPDKVIANALLINEADVEQMYQEIVVKLRNLMGVSNDE